MRAAGAIALQYFSNGSEVGSKGPMDLITEADRAVERYLIAELARLFPEDGTFGEEGADNIGRSGRVWVIDPIDGTFNFVRGGTDWAISLGLYAKAAPRFGLLYFPVNDELIAGGEGLWPCRNDQALEPVRPLNRACCSIGFAYHPKVSLSERFTDLTFLMDDLQAVPRLCGSSVASLAELARGETDAHLGNGEASWDLVAALAILHPLGFRSTIDWSHGLKQRFRFAVGGAEVLELLAPIRPQGALCAFD